MLSGLDGASSIDSVGTFGTVCWIAGPATVSKEELSLDTTGKLL